MSPFELPHQIPLDLAVPPRLSRDDLLVSASNRSAAALIDAWPQWSSPLAVLVGPEGSGKSHLAQIWLEKAGAQRVADVKAQTGTAHREAILIEDMGEREFDDIGLFHLMNRVAQSSGSLLVTSRKRPNTWNVSLPDLASRINAATIAELGEPDDQLLAAVLSKLFADRQVTVEANVIAYLISRMERSLGAAAQMVERLDRLALEKKVRISRALASTILSDTDPRQAELGF